MKFPNALNRFIFIEASKTSEPFIALWNSNSHVVFGPSSFPPIALISGEADYFKISIVAYSSASDILYSLNDFPSVWKTAIQDDQIFTAFADLITSNFPTQPFYWDHIAILYDEDDPLYDADMSSFLSNSIQTKEFIFSTKNSLSSHSSIYETLDDLRKSNYKIILHLSSQFSNDVLHAAVEMNMIGSTSGYEWIFTQPPCLSSLSKDIVSALPGNMAISLANYLIINYFLTEQNMDYALQALLLTQYFFYQSNTTWGPTRSFLSPSVRLQSLPTINDAFCNPDSTFVFRGAFTILGAQQQFFETYGYLANQQQMEQALREYRGNPVKDFIYPHERQLSSSPFFDPATQAATNNRISFAYYNKDSTLMPWAEWIVGEDPVIISDPTFPDGSKYPPLDGFISLYPYPVDLAFMVLTCIVCGLILIVLFATFVLFVLYRETPIISVASPVSQYVSLIGMCMFVLCALMRAIPMTLSTCRLLSLERLTAVVILSPMIIKSIHVTIVYNEWNWRGFFDQGLTPIHQFLINFVLIGISIACYIASVFSNPIILYRSRHNDGLHLSCAAITISLGDQAAYYSGIAYSFLVLLIALIFSIVNRNIPSILHETKYTFYSSLVFAFFEVINYATKLQLFGVYVYPIVAVSLTVFLILTIFITMFVPRIYIILFVPHLNNIHRILAMTDRNVFSDFVSQFITN